MKVRKYKVDAEAVCSDCIPAAEYHPFKPGDPSVDTWAKKHVAEHPEHIVTIHETHDVAQKKGYL